MIPKSIGNIGLNDLTALVGTVRESKTLEFKRELPSGKDGDLTLLKGVSAMANTAGGDFLIGIEAANDGIATSVVGIAPANVDAEKLRLEQLLAACLEPRLPRIDIHTVPCGEGRYVFIIRAPLSWIAPHRVTRDNKFYGRNSAGTYPLDVSELRTAFLMGETTAERIRAFRTDRLAKITAGETPIAMAGKSAVVLHVIPAPPFANRQTFDIVTAVMSGTHVPLPLGSNYNPAGQHHVNLDGFLSYIAPTQDGARSYAQLFRNGALEGVSVMNTDQDGPYVVDMPLGNMVVAGVKQYLSVLDSLDMGFPIFAMLSFCGAKGCRMRYAPGLGGGWYMTPALTNNVIALPEAALDRAEVAAVPVALQPTLNAVWNAFGFARCEMYNATGGWMGTA